MEQWDVHEECNGQQRYSQRDYDPEVNSLPGEKVVQFHESKWNQEIDSVDVGQQRANTTDGETQKPHSLVAPSHKLLPSDQGQAAPA